MSSKKNVHKKVEPEFYIRSPGAGAYRLPPVIGRKGHALTHSIRPAYSIAHGRGSQYPTKYPFGPGTGKYGLTYGLKANGKNIGFMYTIRSKCDYNPGTNFPGPGSYTLPSKSKGPAFTFRMRTPFFLRTKSPSPNTYLLNSMIGPKVVERNRTQEISMKGRKGGEKDIGKTIGPGPAGYDIPSLRTIKNSAPSYTFPIFDGRTKLNKWKPTCGPSSYDPTFKIYPRKASYPFGIRFNEFTANLLTECDKPKQLFNSSR